MAEIWRTDVAVVSAAVGEMVVLRCTGKIVAGEGLKGLQRTATTQRATALIIDLRQVEALDAAGLGTFLRIKQWCDAQGMNLKFIHPGKNVQEVLALTGLDSVLDVCPASTDDEVQALLRGLRLRNLELSSRSHRGGLRAALCF